MPNEAHRNDRRATAWSLATSNAANMLTTLIIGGLLFAMMLYMAGEMREEMLLERNKHCSDGIETG